MNDKDDIELIEKSKKKDKEAFRLLVDRYKNYIFSIVLSKIRSYEEAENIVQEVFLQIFLSLEDYKNDNFKAWIGRIAFNKSIDYIRKTRKEFKDESLDLKEEKLQMLLINNIDPSEELVNKEKGELLIEILENIPVIYSDTIKKHYINQKSYEEISIEENISIKTVETRMYRGRKLIQEIWRDKYEAL